ncbi:hypothetical protein WUBG_15891 [Wuchereria bancrofti]|uniref:Uncharacterized protein n=1 Tax=Wuchereria bancrofti TaxID=6293 RepID=J9ECS6_WUCBA|nr:hypothetical protein WUBG_15891 [Wuchereria bancrofti]
MWYQKEENRFVHFCAYIVPMILIVFSVKQLFLQCFLKDCLDHDFLLLFHQVVSNNTFHHDHYFAMNFNIEASPNIWEKYLLESIYLMYLLQKKQWLLR